MNKLTLLTGSSALALSLVSGAAFAQQATTPQTVVAQNTPEQQTAAEAAETVVVSASRISIAGYTAPTPVSVVDSGQLQQAANSDIGETLRQLPTMGTAQSPVAATEGNAGNSGAVGISSVNLRNLGVTRTLVLIDGDREVWAGVQYGVDLDTIPSIMIQRVDVVTGGASAAWGSDAVAGVVNLIIDKNFTGLKGSVDLMDTADDTRRQYGFSVANGFDFDGDRGHIELAGTYSDSPNTMYMSQLKWFDNQALVANPLYNATTNPGVPQLIHINGAGSSSPPGGYISGATLNSGATTTALNNIQFGPNSQISNFSAPNCNYYANSNLPPYISATTSKTNTTCSGGSTNYSNSPAAIGLASYPLLTETGFFLGSYKVTSNIVASAMLNYSKVSAVGSSLTIQENAVVNSGNPYIPASVQTQMTALGAKSITVTSVGTASTQGGFIQGTPGVGPEQFEDAFGTPEEVTNRQFYRGVFKLDGSIGNDWSWTASYQHSETHLHEHYNSIEISSNFANAVNAVTVTAANQGTSGLAIGSVACASTLTNPTNGCAPYNPFGTGVVSPASLNYIVDHNDYYFLNMEEDTAHAGMQGVLPWDLTGAGAPAVTFGYDYRKETMVSKADPFGSLGALGGGNFVPITAEYNTNEGYAELDLPIIKNGFVESLDGNMAGRITDYSTSGMVETWKMGLTSQIDDDIRLRGTWSYDIRAPDLAELFNDIPASGGQVDYKNGVTEAVALSEAAGNPNLQPEKSVTISAGVVLTPHWVPGLTMSFDAYSIDVKDIVVAPSAAFERTACVAGTPLPTGVASNPTTGTGYCADWVYNPALANTSNVNGLQFVYTYPFNNGYLKTSGIDFNADYQMDFFEGTLIWHLAGNYTDEETETEFGVKTPAGAQATYDFAGSLSGASQFTGGVPKVHAILSATYNQGPWSGTVQTRYLGPAVLTNGWTSGVQVDNNSVPQVAYLDLRGSYKWNDNLQFYAAVDNVMDTPPPNIASYSVSNNGLSTVNPSIYDVLGRMYHAGFRFNY
ncbi:MAG TPA: TonB-dependent receptor [Rhizomicrobium sp.]|jgi:outer membrane receptor protein involved in Fe transport|nr:TonB-dependent receptor [Rhizomicrobium sp.]